MLAIERWLATLVGGLGMCLVAALLVTQAGSRHTGRVPGAEVLMLALVNEARAEQDLHPLRRADDVADVAYAWSVDMADTREFDHNPAHPDQICCWSVVTENVAFSERYPVWHPGDPVERITRELHDELLHSPGHRANILDPHVDEVGIGIHVGRHGSVWITQNFRGKAAG